MDPFSSGSLTYSTNGVDTFPAPSAYQSNAFSWVHIFPEGRVHQHPKKTMRYFKWGISRLILEAEPLPTIVPIFIDGNQNVMHESRQFPRFIPRPGNNITVAFGEEVDGEKVFGDLRDKWKKLVELQKISLIKKGTGTEMAIGDLTDGLKYHDEAVALRMEVTKRVRLEVLKVRKSLGYPDEDPKEGLVDTWIQEGPKREGKMDDGSWTKDT
jgi:monolysocardiolipin acyltransferase